MVAASVTTPAYLTEEWTATRPTGDLVTRRSGDDEIIAAFERLRAWQDHRCAVCGLRALGDPSLTWASPLHLDHDNTHAYPARHGLVRGFLCVSCNLQEGRAPADDPLWKLYRERPPACLAGLLIGKYDLHRILIKASRPSLGRPASSRSRLGVQPAAALVRRFNRTVGTVAKRLGVDVNHLYGVLNGHINPSHEVVTRLTTFLGVPVTELFTPEALAHLHEVRPGRPARPLVPGTYDVDGLALRADRPRGRPPRFPRDLPRPLEPPGRQP